MGCLLELLTAPLKAAIWLIRLILNATGRALSLLIGLAVCAGGAALCLTIVGAIIGIPLLAFGAALMVKSIF